MPDVPQNPREILADSAKRAGKLHERMASLRENLVNHPKTDANGVERCRAVESALQAVLRAIEAHPLAQDLPPATAGQKEHP